MEYKLECDQDIQFHDCSDDFHVVPSLESQFAEVSLDGHNHNHTVRHNHEEDYDDVLHDLELEDELHNRTTSPAIAITSPLAPQDLPSPSPPSSLLSSLPRSSTDEATIFAADRLLAELASDSPIGGSPRTLPIPTPHSDYHLSPSPHTARMTSHSPYSSSPTHYDQFFEEVSLDLPRDHLTLPSAAPPTGGAKLFGFSLRKSSSNTVTGTLAGSPTGSDSAIYSARGKFSASAVDVSGPYWSISDVLNDTGAATVSSAAAMAASISMSPSASFKGREDQLSMVKRSQSVGKRSSMVEVKALGGGSKNRLARRPSAGAILNPFSKSHHQLHPLDANISKTRPRMLPPKNPVEEKRHLQEHEAMMKKAKALEEKRAKETQKKKEERDRHFQSALHTWEADILPHWRTKRYDKKTRELWLKGVPPRCRGKVWTLCIGNSLGVSKDTFDACSHRERRSTESARDLISPIVSPSVSTSSRSKISRNRHHRHYSGSVSDLDVVISENERDDNSDFGSVDDGILEDLREAEEGLGDMEAVDFGSGDEGFVNGGRRRVSFRLGRELQRPANGDTPGRRAGSLQRYPQESRRRRSSQGLLQGLQRRNKEEETEAEEAGKRRLRTASVSTKGEEGTDVVDYVGKMIDEDIMRTLPSLCIFTTEGPMYEPMKNVLEAYQTYRTDVPYIRGTSFLAGMLLLNMEAPEAFVNLANLVQISDVLRAFFLGDEEKIRGYFKVFNVLFAENFPKLYLHFKNLSLTPNNYLPDWFITLFSSILPLELSARLWDLYFLQGDIILFKTGLAVLKYLEPLLWGGSFGETARTLGKGFVGDERDEDMNAVMAVSGKITRGEEDRFFDEVMGNVGANGRIGVSCDPAKWKELCEVHLPPS